jgi:hypothetical protein
MYVTITQFHISQWDLLGWVHDLHPVTAFLRDLKVYASPHLNTEADPVSETLFSSYLEFRMTNSKNGMILSVIQYCRNTSDSRGKDLGL